MRTNIQSTLLIGIVAGIAAIIGTMLVPVAAYADQVSKPDQTCDTNSVNVVEGVDCSKGSDTQSTLFEEDSNGNSLFKTITNVLLFLIGAVAVIMIVIGGIRYVLSNGDPSQVTNAKNTIMYSVIGLVVALLAYAIVNFVVSSFIEQ